MTESKHSKIVARVLHKSGHVPALHKNGLPILTKDLKDKTLEYMTIDEFLAFLDMKGYSFDTDTLLIDLRVRKNTAAPGK